MNAGRSILMRQAVLARRRIQFAGICALLLWSGAVGLAPQGSRAAASPPPVATPDPAHDPPRTLDAAGLPVPRLRAAAAVVYDPASHEILWESNSSSRRPIASITKVMTALVFLERQPDLDADVVVSRRDVRLASTTYLRRGERLSLYDLLHLALVASDNVAARVLARVSPWGTRGFVEQMNAKAAEMGLRGTTFTDPSGLDSGNVSTAYDVSRLIAQATNRPVISTIMRKKSHSLRTSRRRVRVRNTNRLLRGHLLVHGGKTGYIAAAGYCLATVVKLNDRAPLSIVVLGAGSNARRFSEVRRLADWVSEHGAALSPPASWSAD